MAGVKGMKGGGGARPGAGRKPKARDVGALTAPATPHASPLEVLLMMMRDATLPAALRIKAAQAAAPYVHPKLGESGKKEQKAESAKRVAGKFAASSPPRLPWKGSNYPTD